MRRSRKNDVIHLCFLKCTIWPIRTGSSNMRRRGGLLVSHKWPRGCRRRLEINMRESWNVSGKSSEIFPQKGYFYSRKKEHFFFLSVAMRLSISPHMREKLLKDRGYVPVKIAILIAFTSYNDKTEIIGKR